MFIWGIQFGYSMTLEHYRRLISIACLWVAVAKNWGLSGYPPPIPLSFLYFLLWNAYVIAQYLTSPLKCNNQKEGTASVPLTPVSPVRSVMTRTFTDVQSVSLFTCSHWDKSIHKYSATICIDSRHIWLTVILHMIPLLSYSQIFLLLQCLTWLTMAPTTYNIGLLGDVLVSTFYVIVLWCWRLFPVIMLCSQMANLDLFMPATQGRKLTLKIS